MMLHSIYESQDPELCQILPRRLQVTGLPIAARECTALKFIIAHKKLELLQVSQQEDSLLPCELLRIFAPSLKLNMPKYIHMMGIDMQGEGVKIIAEAINETHIETLAFEGCVITGKGSKELSEALCGSKIMTFSLTQTKIGNTGLKHIAHNLSRTVINTLDLCNCGITDEGIVMLSSILQDTQIHRLALSENHISTRGLNALADAIMRTPHLSGLYIKNYMSPTIATEGIKALLITVTYHPTFCFLLTSEKDSSELSDTIEYVNKERRKLGLGIINVMSEFQASLLNLKFQAIRNNCFSF